MWSIVLKLKTDVEGSADHYRELYPKHMVLDAGKKKSRWSKL